MLVREKEGTFWMHLINVGRMEIVWEGTHAMNNINLWNKAAAMVQSLKGLEKRYMIISLCNYCRIFKVEANVAYTNFIMYT